MGQFVRSISKHARERYAERIMDKDGTDVVTFAIKNEKKILDDINKMVEYGELLYTQESFVKGTKSTADIFLNGTWAIIVDSKTKVCITLYKIELGVGEEFNKEYISKKKEVLLEAKKKCESAKEEVTKEVEYYNQQIEDNERLITDYKDSIKKLTTLNDNYRSVLRDIKLKESLAEKEINSILESLIGKPESWLK